MAIVRVTAGIIFLAFCIVFCSAARGHRRTATFNKGTQTPRVWQWPDNRHTWWDDYWATMRLWLRPHIWSKALDRMSGFPMMPFPMTVSTHTDFSDQLDRQLFGALLDDPWDRLIAGQGQGQDQKKCLCSDGAGNHPITGEAESAIDDNIQGEKRYSNDHQQRRHSHSDDEEYNSRHRDSRVKGQPTQRYTQRSDESMTYNDNNFSNDQRRGQENVQYGNDREGYNNMGNYASNQQPTTNGNNMRQPNQNNLKRQVDVTISNDEHEFNGRHGYDIHRNAEPLNKRFGNGRHNNRDSYVTRNNQNSDMTRPMKVYSLQVVGYKPSELQVKTEGRTVRVQGKQACGCQDSCLIREFQRVFTLPEGLDTRNLQATLSKDGTLSVQTKNNQRLTRGHYEDRDILVEGLDLPPIEDSSKNTENCVKKASIKLAKINKHTGKRIPVTRHDEVVQRTFENEHEDDGLTIEVVDE